MEDGPRTPVRPSKRRKVTPTPAKAPQSSRILKSVEQSVPAKQPKRSEKDVSDTNVTPRKQVEASMPKTARIEKQKPAKEAAAEAAGNQYNDIADELGDDHDGTMTTTPNKPRSSGRRNLTAKVQVVTGTGTVGNTTRARDESPTRRRNKKYKGWEYLPEGEEAGINNQDAFAKIAEEAAIEAARAQAEGDELATVSAKSLRERKRREPPKPVRVDKKRTDQPEKRAQEKRQGTNKGSLSRKREETQAGRDKSGASTLLAEDESGDDLQEEGSSDEVAAVRDKTPKKVQSGSKSTQREGSEEIFDVDGPWSTPKKSLFVDRSIHRDTEKLSQLVSPDESSKAALQEDFVKAANHLEQLLSQNAAALNIIKTHLIPQLTSKCHPPILPAHLSREHEKLHQLLAQTVQAGEGNSMLIIGSRGSGKSALVERAVSDLTHSNKEDFHIVRLNGFIHTDDKLALREIWRQLGKDLEGSDEEIGLRTNYADTLTSLLALLSHQDDTQYENEEHKSTTRSIIFILDEFDLFTHHPRQTLLYNLFDVAQSHRNAPIAVLGLTTKINIIDHLEKRVKSRFSQRTLHVPLPKSFPIFRSACLNALTYRSSPSTSLPLPILSAWNTYITSLLSTPPFITLLQSHHHLTNLPTTFLSQTALPLLYALTPSTLSSPQISPLRPPDSPLFLLPSLTTLQLSLLIAVCRLDILLSTDICNFNMAYEEYTRLVVRGKVQWSHAGGSGSGGRVWGRGVARGAWEGLGSVGLLVRAGGGGGEAGWRAEVGSEEIGAWLDGEEGRKCVGGAGAGLGKWCREL